MSCSQGCGCEDHVLSRRRMLGSLAVIGLLGLGVERLVFAALERRTVERWGLVRGTSA